MKNNEIESVLKLKKLVFEKINFERLGFRNDKELELKIKSSISESIDDFEGGKLYKVSLFLYGNKTGEYNFKIGLSGFFNIGSIDNLEDDLKNSLITKNSVAILMPYLRSQVSILTAQPEVECVVLPPFNINNMLDSSKQ